MLLGTGEDAMATARVVYADDAAVESEAVLKGTPDTYFQFFDISGAVAGDRFTLLLTKGASGTNPNVAYLGLTLD